MALRVVGMLTTHTLHVLTLGKYIMKQLTQLYQRWKHVLINQATMPMKSWEISC